ncbi:MAG TPA: hypothetical protein VMT31_06440 [Methanomicrobiales archaeon]|nr:hypothetical protein [Methanomicrobiales archaeon]
MPAADAGPDLPGSVAAIRDERLYSLVQGGDYSEHTLELDIPGPGFGAYTFTFG